MTQNQQNKRKQLRHTAHSQENNSGHELLSYSFWLGVAIFVLTTITILMKIAQKSQDFNPG